MVLILYFGSIDTHIGTLVIKLYTIGNLINLAFRIDFKKEGKNGKEIYENYNYWLKFNKSGYQTIFNINWNNVMKYIINSLFSHAYL